MKNNTIRSDEFQKMVDHANAFLDASRQLIQLPVENGILDIKFVPCVVMLSFSVEIYFKALIFKSLNSYVRGHDFKILFSNLTDEHKACIKSNFKSIDFHKNLDDISNAFERWRYIYEGEVRVSVVNMNFIYELAISLSGILDGA